MIRRLLARRRAARDEIAHLTAARVDDRQVMARLGRLLDERTGERDRVEKRLAEACADVERLIADRNAWRTRAETAERERDQWRLRARCGEALKAHQPNRRERRAKGRR